MARSQCHAGLMLDSSLSGNRSALGRGRVPEGRRVLDLAEGILIGQRRYSAEAAFDELVAVARRHDITISAAATALMELAVGVSGDLHPVETTIAQHEWGSLLAATSEANEHLG